MTIDPVEFRKMQYARELAAYTLRQWNLTYEALENKRSFALANADPVSQQPQQNSRTRSDSRVRDGAGTGTAGQNAPAHVESSHCPRTTQANGR